MTVRPILSIGHPTLREDAADIPVDEIGFFCTSSSRS